MKVYLKIALQSILILVILDACSPTDVIYDNFTEIPGGKWNEKDTISNTFSIEDKGFHYTIYLNLRIKNDYKYSNIYLRSSLGPNYQNNPFKRKHVLLASPDGKWLGKGKGELITLQIPLYKELQFNNPGEYQLKMCQEMRDLDLDNVVSAGIMVKKGNPVF